MNPDVLRWCLSCDRLTYHAVEPDAGIEVCRVCGRLTGDDVPGLPLGGGA